MRRSRRGKGNGKKNQGGRGCTRLSLWTLLRCEWEQVNRTALLIGGGVMVLLGLLCIAVAGSPLHARHLLKLPGCMPASWCLFLLELASCFLLGALIGGLLAAPSQAHLRDRFHGLALLVAFALFRLFWYPLFFGVLAPALALLSLILAGFLCICAAFALRSAFRLAMPVLLIELCVCGWLTYANCIILLIN